VLIGCFGSFHFLELPSRRVRVRVNDDITTDDDTLLSIRKELN
jgi:hypothetical protein